MKKEYQSIPLSRIKRAKVEVRLSRDMEALKQLAANIKSDGVTQPITVRPTTDDMYEIVAGHRRFDASRIAGMKTIPAIIEDVSDDDAIVRAFTENELRESMTPLDTARALRTIMSVKGWSLRELEERGIKSHTSASELLLYLDEYEKGVVPSHDEFSNPKDYGLAKTMVVRRAFKSHGLDDMTEIKREVMDKIAKDGLSIEQSREVAALVAREVGRVLEHTDRDKVTSEASNTLRAIFNTNAKDPAFRQIVRALSVVYKKQSGEYKKEERPDVVSQPMQDYIKALRDYGAALRRAYRMVDRFSPESVHRLGKWHAEIVTGINDLEKAIQENE